MKIWAKNAEMQKLLVHPSNGVAFPLNIEEPIDWPPDQFTFKRLADGDVLDHAPSSQAKEDRAPADVGVQAAAQESQPAIQEQAAQTPEQAAGTGGRRVK